jgi:hypothetical protein
MASGRCQLSAPCCLIAMPSSALGPVGQFGETTKISSEGHTTEALAAAATESCDTSSTAAKTILLGVPGHREPGQLCIVVFEGVVVVGHGVIAAARTRPLGPCDMPLGPD